MLSGPVYNQSPSALPLLDQTPNIAVNNTTATSFYSSKGDGSRPIRGNTHKKSRSPVWLRGVSQKNEQARMVAKPQMLFPLEPPIDEKSKNFNQTVHLDPAYLDASII
jgi:hypothetical protein